MDPITEQVIINDEFTYAFEDLINDDKTLQVLDELGIETGNVFGKSVLGIHGSETEMTVASAVIAALIARAAYRLYKDKLTKAGRKCSYIKHGTTERKACERKAKVDAMKAQINVMKAGMNSKCGKAKEPEKCKAKVQNKIKDIQTKMQNLE